MVCQMARSLQRTFSLPIPQNDGPDNNFFYNGYVTIADRSLTFPYNERQKHDQKHRILSLPSPRTAMMVAKMVALTAQIKRSQCRVVQLTADVEELTAINAHLSEGCVNLERSLKDLQEDPGVVAIQEQMMHHQGDYIMKVEGFSHLQDDCQAFCPRQMFGEAFLTSEAGYLMRLILYPRGRDSGQGTHLSVSFQIMQGPFDDVLPWPFTGEVAISLLPHGADQGGPPHTQVLRDGPLDCLQRPTSAPNQERGEARFFPLMSLLEGGPFSHGDRLFLKISVRGSD